MNHPARTLATRFIFAACVIALIGLPNFGCGTAQRAFDSPEQAAQSLAAAIRARDTKALHDIFGPGSDEILFSGDPVDDRRTQDQFLRAYERRHQLDPDGDKSVALLVGDDAWPFPIPIARNESGKGWVFDTAGGKDEVITRRIGRNELAVIEVCKAICDAEREYVERNENGDAVPAYARKIVSDPGTTNGLYWPTAEGAPPSPLGEAVAEAQGEGYSIAPDKSGQPHPYHGYLYRILTAQGKDAPGGAEDYVINGKLIGGFAIVAWSVDYGSSGIMTFITNYSGEVYQKDLGENTDKLAKAMAEYNPDPSWKRAE